MILLKTQLTINAHNLFEYIHIHFCILHKRNRKDRHLTTERSVKYALYQLKNNSTHCGIHV